ncbi:MAG: acyl-CoA dehydrogenase family protein [Burkholderiaceae bacterium]
MSNTAVLSRQMAFTDEQAMLLDAAMTFCREQSPIARVRELMTTETGFDPAVWQRMTELGWPGLCIAEAQGGAGLTLAEAAVLTECMGRHLLSTPFVSTQLAVAALQAGADEAVQGLWLSRIAAGLPATVALLEDEGDWRLTAFEACASVAEASGDSDLILAGTKTLVPDAAVAGVVLVALAFEGAPAMAVLPAALLQQGRIQRETVLDETRRCYRIALDGIRMPRTALIRGEAAGRALRAVRQAGLLLTSAEAAGGIASALELIINYLNLRTTFGRKIGSYQSLKHTSAEILVGLERSRSHVAHAATLISTEQSQDALETALRMAKVECCESYVFAGDRGVQFHGGFGFTWECDAQLHLRRALVLQHSFGDATHHRRRLAEALLGPIEPVAV